MTTFQILALVFLGIIAACAVVILTTVIEGFRGVWQNQTINYEELRKIVVNILETIEKKKQ